MQVQTHNFVLHLKDFTYNSIGLMFNVGKPKTVNDRYSSTRGRMILVWTQND